MPRAKTPPRRIEYVRIRDVVPADRNAKAHDSALIHASIGHFDFLDALIRDERTGRLLGGHGRLEVLAGMETAGEAVPGGLTRDADGAWLVPVQVGWSSADDRHAEAAAIALNRTSEVGGWNDTDLAEQLRDIRSADADLPGMIGFEPGQVDRLLEDLRRGEADLTDPTGFLGRFTGNPDGTLAEGADGLGDPSPAPRPPRQTAVDDADGADAYMVISYSVTVEQREVILAAIERAGLPGGDAVVMFAQCYLDDDDASKAAGE